MNYFPSCLAKFTVDCRNSVFIFRTIKMSQKKNILSYFSTAARRKRGTDEAKESDVSSPESNKRPKANESEDQKPEVEKTSLSPEQKQMIEKKRQNAILRLENNSSGMLSNMGDSWRDALSDEFTKEYFQKLKRFVDSERKSKTIFPPEEDVFSWTQLCEMENVKVVIIGQDPYHGPKQAHGLCFSVRIGVPPPPSLVNIYKELKQDIDGFEIPDHGFLAGWAQQGVLLLNAVLTVVAHNANSHQGKGWEQFTDAVIKKINSKFDGVVFLLWGAYAQKKGASIDKKRHCVLKGPHPSPLSAHRGFFGCKHFSQANEYLKKHGKKEIDWCLLPKKI